MNKILIVALYVLSVFIVPVCLPALVFLVVYCCDGKIKHSLEQSYGGTGGGGGNVGGSTSIVIVGGGCIYRGGGGDGGDGGEGGGGGCGRRGC